MMYVAYGSNMNMEQMAYRCPNSHVVGNGVLIGWKLVFNVHADIIETDDCKDSVPVVVWDIADEDWQMLDWYEGYPTYYIRRNVDVSLDSGDIAEAIVYVMTDKCKGICQPSNSYLSGIIYGCVENGIDIEYLFDALKYSIENETENNQYNMKAV